MFDSHCHLTDDRFAGDLAAVIGRAWDAGLVGLVTIASDAADAEAASRIAAIDPRIRATAGVHPHVSGGATAQDLAAVAALLERPEMVAIGETGLDYYYDSAPRPVQRRLFEWHLELAARTGAPVVVHSRDADDDTAAMIRTAAGVRGVLHCFTGAAGLFDAACDADWYVSFSGLVTFRDFDNHALLRATPPERLLLETDSPYLAPVPHRGRRNEPAYVVDTCRAVAALLDEVAAVTAARTTANARRFYGLDGTAAGA